MGAELKNLFRRSFILSGLILLGGILSLIKSVQGSAFLIAMFIGSLISIGTLFMTYLDARESVYSNNPMSYTVSGYLKRYLIYGVFLFILMKFFSTGIFIYGAIGLLNVKFNILLSALLLYLQKLKNRFEN